MSRLARASVLTLCLVATRALPSLAQEKPAAADVVFYHIVRPSKEKPRPGEASLAYFVGAFLKNRGEADKSRDYFLRCARTQNYQLFNYVLACQALHDLKVPIPKPSGPEASLENEGEDAQSHRSTKSQARERSDAAADGRSGGECGSWGKLPACPG
jgi:hypothetical protein